MRARAPSLPCPVCAYDLVATRGTICPECGSRFEYWKLLRELKPLFKPGTIAIFLGSVFVYPALCFAAIVGLGEDSVAIKLLAPYAVIMMSLSHSGPVWAAGTIFQGPAYGLILGHVRGHASRKTLLAALLAMHVAATAIALLFC